MRPDSSARQRDAAPEGHTVRSRPAFQVVEIVVIDQKAGIAGGANHRHSAVVTALAPLDQVAIGMAFAFAQVTNDRLQRGRHISDDLSIEGDSWIGHNDIPRYIAASADVHNGAEGER